MTTPINLNKARKARARTDKRREADRNAVKFGRGKSDKALDAARREKAARDLDGHAKE